MEIIKQKALPYYQRGYSAVVEQRPLRALGEAAEIIKTRLLQHGLDEYWAEGLAGFFARSYIAGTVAATRPAASDPVEQFEPCLEVHYDP
jgi:hypothetical protein